MGRCFGFASRLHAAIRASQRVLAFVLLISLLCFLRPAFAARLGGAYYVDDAEIGKVGSCEIESWSSFAGNGDRISVFSPACVFNFGRPVELGTNLVNLRSEGERDTLATLTAKTVPIPIVGSKGFGLAVAGAVVYDPLNRTGNGLILNVPLTFDFSKQLRVNINFGAQYYSGDPHGLFGTAGAGVSWTFVPKWSVISEIFAFMASGQMNPRLQSGLRYSPTKSIDWDLIYGRNLTGEGANWITVGLTVRTGENGSHD
jgi:hypothetical protein